MTHHALGAVNGLYPSLTTIVGSVIDGRPNWMTVAHVGIMNHGQPQYLSFGINKHHHTGPGIHANGEFSVCIPGVELVAEGADQQEVGWQAVPAVLRCGIDELFSDDLDMPSVA